MADLQSMILEREQRKSMLQQQLQGAASSVNQSVLGLQQQLEATKAEGNRVIGECQGKLAENDVTLTWLRGLKEQEDQAAAQAQQEREAQLAQAEQAEQAEPDPTYEGDSSLLDIMEQHPAQGEPQADGAAPSEPR